MGDDMPSEGEPLTYAPDAVQLVRRPLLLPSPLQRYTSLPFHVDRRGEITFIASGGDSPGERMVLIISNVSPSTVIREANDVFGRGAYSIVIESGTNPALVEHLDQAGWTIDEDEPAMLLRPIPPIPEQSSHLRIEPVTTQEQLDDFLNISETGRRWIPSLEAATDPQVCLLLGYLDDEPVATSRLNCLDDLGEINGVVTDPAFRRRGFGTDMTWAAIAVGVERGCTAIMLTASEMGYPVYRKMGFTKVCSYRTYMPPEDQD